MGADVACPPEGMPAYAKPLVVDMPGAERGDVEMAMRDGPVTVSYDCNTLKVVPDCSVAAAYGFAAFNPKEESIRMTNAEVAGWFLAGLTEAGALATRS